MHSLAAGQRPLENVSSESRMNPIHTHKFRNRSKADYLCVWSASSYAKTRKSVPSRFMRIRLILADGSRKPHPFPTVWNCHFSWPSWQMLAQMQPMQQHLPVHVGPRICKKHHESRLVRLVWFHLNISKASSCRRSAKD